MADSKSYYYLKLKDNFFDSDEIVALESLQDGYIFENILFKMYLRSLKNEGKLMLANKIPYTPAILANLVRHKETMVAAAVEIFKQLGLVEVLDSGAIYMADIQSLIGNSSTEADRKREYRKRIDNEASAKLQLKEQNTSCPENVQTNGGQIADNNRTFCGQTADICPDICPPEIRDYNIELKDKSLENRNKITKNEDNISSCSERKNRSELKATPPDEPTFISLVLNDGSEYHVPAGKVEEWKKLYPIVDVEQELRSMRGWCDGNPTKRKTKTGIMRFIHSWLGKAQNNGGSGYAVSRSETKRCETQQPYTAGFTYRGSRELDNPDTLPY